MGQYAGYLANSFKESKYCNLAGLITGTPSKSKDWGNKYNVLAENIYSYQNFDEIVNNKNIDLVYVCLPNSMHKEYVIRAAKAKIHIIVEKPMANSVKDCEVIVCIMSLLIWN